MTPSLRLGVASLLVVALSGCGGHYHSSHHRHGSSTFGLLVAGAAVGAVIVAASPPRPRRVYVRETRTYYVQPPPAFVQTPPPPEGPVRFDPYEGRRRLNAVNLSDCGGMGAPPGYGHAKVTFNPDGRVSKVVVDQPANLSPELVACVGRHFGETTVPPYNGNLVTMGTSFLLPQ